MLRFAASSSRLAAVRAGCQPVYETGYRFDLPAAGGEAAQACVAQLRRPRRLPASVPAREEFAACRERAILVQDQCRSNAQIDYQICQRAYAPDGADLHLPDLRAAACEPAAIDLCEADYRRCFAGCGGTVVEERRCVANCPS